MAVVAAARLLLPFPIGVRQHAHTTGSSCLPATSCRPARFGLAPLTAKAPPVPSWCWPCKILSLNQELAGWSGLSADGKVNRGGAPLWVSASLGLLDCWAAHSEWAIAGSAALAVVPNAGRVREQACLPCTTVHPHCGNSGTVDGACATAW